MLFKTLVVGTTLIILTQLAEARYDTAAEFLTFGVGARASGMGEAFCAVANDSTATHFNPAGLGFMKQKAITAMYNSIYEDIIDGFSHSFFSYVRPVSERSTLGASINLLQSGSHPITEYDETLHKVRIIGKFYTYDLATVLSWGRLIRDNFALGANLKYIYSNYYISTRAYAFDLGVLYHGLKQNNLSVGVVLENIGTKIAYIDKPQADSLPMNLKIGVAYSVADLLFAFDFNKPFYDDFVGVNLGIESSLTKVLVGRIGYFNKGGNWEGITYGFGIDVNGWKFDFANLPAGDLGRTNRISLSVAF